MRTVADGPELQRGNHTFRARPHRVEFTTNRGKLLSSAWRKGFWLAETRAARERCDVAEDRPRRNLASRRGTSVKITIFLRVGVNALT
jgi:hypothetical protein